MKGLFDVAIIGGGINGCGCAADAALRGLNVYLCDKGPLAAATSSNSSKLIHGGLRYLEYYDIHLVKKALDERQRLLQLAPHLIHPLAFTLPLKNSIRSSWRLKIGLFIYDHLSRANRLPHSQAVSRNDHPKLFAPLQPTLGQGFMYYDCATDDGRLTLTNALQAKEHGATIHPYTECVHAEIQHGVWVLTLQSHQNPPFQIQAKTLINATGPWVELFAQKLNVTLDHRIALVKGSHILLPKLYEGDHAYLMQHSDQRIVFVLPFHGYSMVGTTDTRYHGSPDAVCIDDDEIDYLLTLVNEYFVVKYHRTSIVHTWSGVRPLVKTKEDRPSAMSRDYTIQTSSQPAPCITIYGGKITTYRTLAEEVINQLKPWFSNLPPSKTATTPLPGSYSIQTDPHQYAEQLSKTSPWCDQATLLRYVNTYGTRAEQILDGCKSMQDLGLEFAPTFYAKEIKHLIDTEWARDLSSLLWVHTKMGLSIDEKGCKALQNYLQNHIKPITWNNCFEYA